LDNFDQEEDIVKVQNLIKSVEDLKKAAPIKRERVIKNYDQITSSVKRFFDNKGQSDAVQTCVFDRGGTRSISNVPCGGNHIVFQK
jgi:hypothetical protein